MYELFSQLWTLTNYLFWFFVAIIILVAVHEYGHFWMARRLGVKVLRFSVGFGPPVWKRTAKDGTEYVFAAIPLGGYVRMLGESDDKVPEADKGRAFNSKPVGYRMAIVLAGPFANIFFALFAFWIMFQMGIEGRAPVVSATVSNSVAEKAGFQNQDVITAINGSPVASWQSATLLIYNALAGREKLEVRVKDKQGQEQIRRMDFSLYQSDLAPKKLAQDIGLIPAITNQINPVPGDPAAKAGLKQGDRIVAVNEQPVAEWSDILRIIQALPAQAIRLKIERGNQKLDFVVTSLSKTENGKSIGVIGVRPQESATLLDRYGFFESMVKSGEETYRVSALILRVFGLMATGRASLENISGPVRVGEIAGKSAEMGLNWYIRLLALISVSLAIINLLPIPMLDGGHFAYYVIEAIRGKPVSDQIRHIGNIIGLTLILSLMVLAFYNDFEWLLGLSKQ